jgi:hypothetical protein
MGAQTQHKARPQVGRPNAPTQRQGTSASCAPQRKRKARNARPQRKARKARPQMGAQTQRKAFLQDGRPNEKLDPQRKRPHKGALG